MKEIKLSNSLLKALVDDRDFELLSKFAWYPQVKEQGVYAQTWIKTNRGAKQITMHSMLTGYPRTDHRDRNSLNNQRSNLRPCTNAQNSWNSGIYSTNKSGFKGVSFDRRTDSWRAQITFNYTNHNLGRFDTKEEAALAYNEAAQIFFGEFAYQNKIQTNPAI